MEKSILGLITHLKFDVLNGEKIDTFKVENAANSRKLSDYFFDFKLIVIYKSMGFEGNIKYLNERMEELEKDTAEEIVPGKINDKKEKRRSNKKFAYKPIAIACLILNVTISDKTAEGILKKYGQQKVVNELIKAHGENGLSSLTKVSENKSAAKKHFDTLKDAEWIINRSRDKDAKKEIKQVIATFELNYKNRYGNIIHSLSIR